MQSLFGNPNQNIYAQANQFAQLEGDSEDSKKSLQPISEPRRVVPQQVPDNISIPQPLAPIAKTVRLNYFITFQPQQIIDTISSELVSYRNFYYLYLDTAELLLNIQGCDVISFLLVKRGL